MNMSWYWIKQKRIWPVWLAIFSIAILVGSSAVPAAAQDLNAKWSKGIRFETEDGSVKLKVGGRIQYDTTFVIADDDLEADIGEQVGGMEFRRARMYTSGTIYNNVEFKLQMDFAGGEAKFKDTYVGVTNIPGLGGFRAGHWKEPFSLEELTSSKYITFLERSLPSVFWPSRNSGFMFHNQVADDRVTWAFGVFKDVGDDAVAENYDQWNFTGRLTGLPIYSDSGRRLLHLGVSLSRKVHDGYEIRYRQRPEAHLSDRFVNTGYFIADSVTLQDYELAWVEGPFSVQGEYTRASTCASDVGDPSPWGYYVMASAFLTGENRKYKQSSGAFDRVSPHNNLGPDGAGAFEIAVRYSHLRLDDEAIQGGRLSDLTNVNTAG